MTETNTPAVECPTERAIVRALLYFEIFSYPLTAAEVFWFSNCPGTSVEEVADKLNHLVEQGHAFRFGSFFQTQNDSSWAVRRLDCNRRADEILPLARRMARFIGGFPYVRGVFVSGSLSKRCMSAESDIDFFIVTGPRRLWLARTLLVFFKKIFLFNSHKYFCVNYFVDTEHLKIEEQNLFTATETVTLLPMYGREWYEAFCRANGWAWVKYPHYPARSLEGVLGHSAGVLKWALEWLLAGKLGDWLDVRAMRMTVGFWKRKFRHMDESAFSVALKSRRHTSKHHPLHFQEKVLEAFARKVEEAGV